MSDHAPAHLRPPARRASASAAAPQRLLRTYRARLLEGWLQDELLQAAVVEPVAAIHADRPHSWVVAAEHLSRAGGCFGQDAALACLRPAARVVPSQGRRCSNAEEQAEQAEQAAHAPDTFLQGAAAQTLRIERLAAAAQRVRYTHTIARARTTGYTDPCAPDSARRAYSVTRLVTSASASGAPSASARRSASSTRAISSACFASASSSSCSAIRCGVERWRAAR